MRVLRAVLVASLLLGATLSCGRHGCQRSSPPPGPAVAERKPTPYDVAEVVYEGGLKNGWKDYGWAQRDVKGPGPADVQLGNWGGWIIAKETPHMRFGGLVFRMKEVPPNQPEYVEVRVESSSSAVFPRIELRPEHRLAVGDGWVEVLLPMSELNPENLPYDKIVFRAFRKVDPSDHLYLDKIAFTKVDETAAAASAAAMAAHATTARLRIDCHATAKKVSPLIFGIAADGRVGDWQWKLGATARRWGGNTTSRYNWEIGAWNTGMDWFWENVEPKPYTTFLDLNVEHGMKSILTVPILGWVAKDKTSSTYDKSRYPDQQQFDQYRPNAGNGLTKDGKPIPPPDPSTTSIPAPPEFVRRWIEAIKKRDAETGRRSVDEYILDNEPGLWNSTHRDVHPQPMTYDELLDRTLRYGAAVRAADKDAVIAGPASWGWPEYNYSAKDADVSFFLHPDRRAHGDMPLLAWYLKRLKEEEDRTGVHILDVVDVHFYPQAKELANDAVDPKAQALRIRSTRALWDPTYVDESYIKEPVKLLPRLKDWIAQNFPGRGIQIGEWNFGAEHHMSGGLATAEALGRFIQNDVTSAFYWTAPPADSPSFYAFRAYRDFDGKGGRFQDYWLPTFASDRTALYASRDAAGTRVVAVLLNFAPDQAYRAEIDMSGCKVAKRTAYTYTGDDKGLAPEDLVSEEGDHVRELVVPYSITVLDMQLAEPPAAGVAP